MLTNLKNQECLVRISKNGCTYPVFKARTVNYNPEIKPKVKENKFFIAEKLEDKSFDFDFKIDCDVTLKDIMDKTSSSRKKV